MISWSMWKNFKWKMQHEDFTFDLRMMMIILREDQYSVKKSMRTFAANKLEYLEHIISKGRVSTNPKQIQAISDWPKPTSMKQLREFLGPAGYFWCFIKNYGALAKPLTRLLKKNGFNWSKSSISNTEKCACFNTSFSTHRFFNGFCGGDGIGAVPMQQRQPLAFFSKALAPRHQSLSIYEKELMVVVLEVEHWHQYLERRKFIIRIGQQSLRYLLGQKLKTSFQMFWLAKLAGYEYEIQHKGNNNYVVDSLPRLPRQQLMHMALDTSSSEFLQKIEKS